jgi:uracil-DNA glycosylase
MSVKPVISLMSAQDGIHSLNKRYENCNWCPLWRYREQVVFAQLPKDFMHWNGLMLIGEAPGAQEDKQGKPFVGKAGNLLSELLSKANIDREQTYISNTIKCRPPNNKITHPDAIVATVVCPNHILSEEISLLALSKKLKLVVALGATAAKKLVGEVSITKIAGTLYEDEGVYLMVTYHPSYLLRNPKVDGKDLKLQFVEHMQLAKHILDGNFVESQESYANTETKTRHKSKNKD